MSQPGGNFRRAPILKHALLASSKKARVISTSINPSRRGVTVVGFEPACTRGFVATAPVAVINNGVAAARDWESALAASDQHGMDSELTCKDWS